jgi:hypothetical protein
VGIARDARDRSAQRERRGRKFRFPTYAVGLPQKVEAMGEQCEDNCSWEQVVLAVACQRCLSAAGIAWASGRLIGARRCGRGARARMRASQARRDS